MILEGIRAALSPLCDVPELVRERFSASASVFQKYIYDRSSSAWDFLLHFGPSRIDAFSHLFSHGVLQSIPITFII